MTGVPESKTGFVDVNGGRLYYSIAGDGPSLVLIHAGIADSRMWDDQIPALSQHHTVVRYDMRGYGSSSLPSEPFAHNDDLHTLLQTLGIRRTVIMGCSMGGSVAIDFTLAYPDTVDALILVDSGIGGYRHSAATIERFRAMQPAYEAGDLDGLVELELQMWIDGTGRSSEQVYPSVRERVRVMERHNLELNADEELARELEPPAIGRLGEIKVPTLVIVGDRDIPDMLDVADRLATDIPQARKTVIPDAAHLPNMEHPHEFNELVLEFLDKIHPAGHQAYC